MSELKDEEKCAKETCSCVLIKEGKDDTKECLSSEILRRDFQITSENLRCEDSSPSRDVTAVKKQSNLVKEDSKAESRKSTEGAGIDDHVKVVQSHVPITCQPRADSVSTTSSCRFMCRICHGGEDEEDAMISPCLCSGSLQYCHQECLLKWLGWRSTWTCELCSHAFSILNHGLKRPTEWKRVKLDPTERWSLVVLFLALSAMVGSTYFLVWSFTNPMSKQQRKAAEFQVCYALYVVLNLFSVGIVLFYVRPIGALVNRWRAINQHLQVQDYAGRLKKRRLSECSSILVLPSSEIMTSKQLVPMESQV